MSLTHFDNTQQGVLHSFLSQEQTYQIEILKKAGKNQKEIAELLGVSSGSYLCWFMQFRSALKQSKVNK